MEALIFVIAILIVVGVAWFLWPMISRWFSDSETLFWARLQMAVGAVLTVAGHADLGPVLNAFGLGKWSPVIFLATGIVTEVARRNRATDL